eukprot:m51a1_g13383 hypothetical protein (337) ;mRNA; f:948-2342
MAGSEPHVTLRLVGARDLIASDSNGLSDPYAVVRVPGRSSHKAYKTRVVKKSLAPTWDESVDLPLCSGPLLVELFDKDLFRDDPLGSALQPNVDADMWVPLTGVASGQLHVVVTVHDPKAGAGQPAAQATVAVAPPVVAALPQGAAGSSRPIDPVLAEEDPVLKAELAAFARTQFCKSLAAGVQAQSYAAGAGAEGPARDYVILVDNSGSMAGSNWREAAKALSRLAPYACRADPDGITLYFFSDSHSRHDNVRTAQDVEALFRRVQPDAGTNMTGALQAAFDEHFAAPAGRMTTMLVITDGQPANEDSVMRAIREAAGRLARDEDLSVTSTLSTR